MSREPDSETAALRAELAELTALARKAGHGFNNVLQVLILEAERLEEGDIGRIPDIAAKILLAVSRGERLANSLLGLKQKAGQGAAPPVAAAPFAVQASARILVAEDQEQSGDFLQKILEAAGHTVVVAGDGAEAVAAVEAAPFDLVMMDIGMPVMDGLAATRKIRAMTGPRAAVPIVATSGNTQPEQAQSFRDAGMSDHIGKPFGRAAVLRKVDFWLGRETAPACALSEAGTATEFDKICALMGRPWALSGLAKLTAQIDEAFGAAAKQGVHDGELARQAHALISLASLLGFPILSRLCGELEHACKSGLDLLPRYERAKMAAMQAQATAAGIIAAG